MRKSRPSKFESQQLQQMEVKRYGRVNSYTLFTTKDNFPVYYRMMGVNNLGGHYVSHFDEYIVEYGEFTFQYAPHIFEEPGECLFVLVPMLVLLLLVCSLISTTPCEISRWFKFVFSRSSSQFLSELDKIGTCTMI